MFYNCLDTKNKYMCILYYKMISPQIIVDSCVLHVAQRLYKFYYISENHLHNQVV